MRTAIISAGLLGILCIQSGFIAGEPPAKAKSPSQPAAPVVSAAKEESVLEAKESQRKTQVNGLQNYGIKGPLMVYSKHGASHSAALSNPSLVVFGGKTFLTGEEIASQYKSAHNPGRKFWIPLDDVCQMVEPTEKDLDVK